MGFPGPKRTYRVIIRHPFLHFWYRHGRLNTIVSLLLGFLIAFSAVLVLNTPVLAAPSMTLSPASGKTYTSIIVTGSGFPYPASGRVWFDTNNNGAYDSGEPNKNSVQTNSTGSFVGTVSFYAPSQTPAVLYNVYADIPSGGSNEASASFTITPFLSLGATSGPPGSLIPPTGSLNGSGFDASSTGYVWFDTNGDSIRDADEPQILITTQSNGSFPSGNKLTVPQAPAGKLLCACRYTAGWER